MTRLSATVICGLVLALGVGATALPVAADPGDFNPTYADCGLAASSVDNGRPWATAIQPDGKVVEVGSSGSALGVFRFSTNGAVDLHVSLRQSLGFGVTSIMGQDVLVQPDGKIVVLVVTPGITPAASPDLRIARLNSNGTPDTTFGDDPSPTGAFEAPIDAGPTPASYLAARIVRQSTTGKFVVLLRRADGIAKLVRIEADGSAFDATFVPAAEVATTQAWAIGTDGASILLAARATDPNYSLLRLGENGALDAGFPATGSFGSIGTGTFAIPASVAAQTDHSIVVAGTIGTDAIPAKPRQFGFSRHAPNGAVDASFNAGSLHVAFTGQASLLAMTLTADGSIVGVGQSKEGSRNFPAYVRVSTAGAVVPGSFGKFTVDIGASQGLVNRPVGIVPAKDGLNVITGMLIRARGGASFYSALALRLDDTVQGSGYVLQPNGRFRSVQPAGAAPPACVFDNPTSRRTTYRGIALARDRSGLVVDASGGLHRFTAGVLTSLQAPRGGPSWPGADIARGVGLRSKKGGYVVDLFGFLHPFALGARGKPAAARGGPAFPFDAARGVAFMPDGNSGYVVDLFGGLHRFAVGSAALSPVPHGGPSFAFDAARGVAILPDGSGGYVIDLLGGLHPFGIGASAGPSVKPVPSLTPGLDRARGLAFIFTSRMTGSALRAAPAGGVVVEGPRRVIPPPTP